MRAMLPLAAASAWNRRFVVSLVVLSIALATFLVLTLERVRADAREYFTQSVSGTDLVVGPRTGSLQLLLYAVFRVGGATNAMQWKSAEAVGAHRAVAWWVPLALGDSHRGYPVLGTTKDYFTRFHYGERQPLVLAQGARFAAANQAVLGAEVARALGYRLGQGITLSHGDGAFQANDHADKPFVVAGILKPTGTPVDRTVHISLEGLESLHGDEVAGLKIPGLAALLRPAQTPAAAPQPDAVTAVLVGLKDRSAVFSVQRDVAAFRGEPLMAILPAVTLDELWQVVGAGERALQLMTGFVALVSIAGLVAVILAGLEQRRRELAILRAVGAGPGHMLQLLAAEGLLITLAGVALGLLLHLAGVALLGDWLRARYGVGLVLAWPGPREWALLATLVAGGLVASLVPAFRAYRLSLADGLSPRI